MTTTTYPAGTRLRCSVCGAVVVVVVDGTRAWCDGDERCRGRAMRVEPEPEPFSQKHEG